MKYRLKDMLDKIEHQDLVNMKQDVISGGVYLLNLLNEAIEKNEKEHCCSCSNCTNEIDPKSTDTLTVMFGPNGFKKKATFCAKDCMDYFMQKLETINAR